MLSQRVKILLLEDNPEDALMLREALAQERDSPFAVEHATRLDVALRHLAVGDIELVLADLKLPDSDGSETVARMRRQAPEVPIIVLTASDDDTLALEALEHGAQDYLVKGYVQVYPAMLRRAMRYALERKRAQNEIRRAHEKTQTLLSSLPSILIEVSPDDRIIHWNPVAASVFRIPSEQVIDQPLGSCHVGWDVAAILPGIQRCRATNQPVTTDEVYFRRADGQDGYLGVTMIPLKGQTEGTVGVLLFGADITERKQTGEERERLREQLMQAQRVETIGRFAGGIAHDFNNYLQIILGFTGLIRARHHDDPALLNDLQEVAHSAESASGLVQQLLAFSRRRPLQPKIVEVNQHIANMVRLIQQLVGENIPVYLQLTGGSLTAKLDPTGLEQVVMNLCSNARDSMLKGGTLTIGTARVTLDAAFARLHAGARVGEYVRISVQDAGSGMEPDVAARIFEPFFTTKQLGRGTGLGLAVVYGLVTQHEGFIDIKTVVGRGTTFHLHFPYEPAPAAAAPAQSLEAPLPSPTAGKQRPRVLIVDDDASIRVLCSRMLDGMYTTASASSPGHALELLGREPYDILLSDIRMPDMDGLKLSQEAKRIRPGIRILLMTGSLTDDLQQQMQAAPVRCEVLRKPFTAAHLDAALQRCACGELGDRPRHGGG